MDFHFGKIDPTDRQLVEQHLLSCSSCLKEYFELKRDLEVNGEADRPSDIVRHRIRRDFASYVENLVSEETRAWVAARRLKLTFGALAVAAAIFLLLFSGDVFRSQVNLKDSTMIEESQELKSLDEAVDSGRLNPGHINMI